MVVTAKYHVLVLILMQRIIEINRGKKVQISLVSFAHRVLNLLLKEFYVWAIFLKYQIFGNPSRSTLAAWCPGHLSSHRLCVLHKDKSTWLQDINVSSSNSINLISSALARVWAQIEQGEPVQAARGEPSIRPAGLILRIWTDLCRTINLLQ